MGSSKPKIGSHRPAPRRARQGLSRIDQPVNTSLCSLHLPLLPGNTIPMAPAGSHAPSCLPPRVSQCHGCDRAQRGYPQQHHRRAHSRVSQNSGVTCESHTRRTPSARLASAKEQLALRLCTILCNKSLPFAPVVGFSADQHVFGVVGHQCRRPPMRSPPPHEQSS